MDVLLVEDEPLVRETAADALRGAGLIVAEAASAEAALAIAAHAAGRPPSVLVADLRLGPGMGGLALGAEALRRWPGVGVIYATGHPEDLAGRFVGPRERYLVKPYAGAALLRAVRRLMPSRVRAWAVPPARRTWRSESVSAG